MNADLSLSLTFRYLKEGARGKIVALSKNGYNVVFEDNNVAVEYLTDRDVELDTQFKTTFL